MYPEALDCGITPERFWTLSIKEVADIIESHNRIQRKRHKQTLSDFYNLAYMVAQNFNSKTQPKGLYELFPDLFEEELIKEQTVSVEEQRASRARWAAAMQKRFGGL